MVVLVLNEKKNSIQEVNKTTLTKINCPKRKTKNIITCVRIRNVVVVCYKNSVFINKFYCRFLIFMFKVTLYHSAVTRRVVSNLSN